MNRKRSFPSEHGKKRGLARASVLGCDVSYTSAFTPRSPIQTLATVPATLLQIRYALANPSCSVNK